MRAQAFEVAIRWERAGPVLELSGDINAAAAVGLDAAYQEATQDQPELILLNFANTTYINSTGIALIVGILARARQAGIRLVTCGLSEHYQEIFRITRLVDFMTIYPDERSALVGLSQAV